TFAKKVEVDGTTLKVNRQTADGYVLLEASTPALITVTAAIAEPRYASLQGIMAARSKEVKQLTLADLGVERGADSESIEGITDAEARKAGAIIEDDGTAVDQIVKVLADVTAIALGTGAKAAAETLGKHGAKTVYVNEDKAFDEYLAEPAADAIEQLLKQDAADLVLFGFTSDSRDVAGRVAARLGTGLISNASDVTAAGDGFVAKVPYFGGAKIASMRATGKPALILVRPKSFEASESGGTAEVKDLAVTIADGSKRARIVDRVVEQSEKVKLEDAKVVVSGGRGLGGPDNFPLLEDLASALGG